MALSRVHLLSKEKFVTATAHLWAAQLSRWYILSKHLPGLTNTHQCYPDPAQESKLS